MSAPFVLSLVHLEKKKVRGFRIVGLSNATSSKSIMRQCRSANKESSVE